MYLPHHRIRSSYSSLLRQRLFPPCTLLRLSFSYQYFPLLSLAYATRPSFCYILFSPFFSSLPQPPRLASPSHQRDDPHAPLFYAGLVLFSTWYTRGSMSPEGGEARPLFFLHPAPSIRASESRWLSKTTQQRVHPSNLLSLFLASVGRAATIRNCEQRKERHVA